MKRWWQYLSWRRIVAAGVAVVVPGGIPLFVAAVILTWWKTRQAKKLATPLKETTC